jgi:hypothetical protein
MSDLSGTGAERILVPRNVAQRLCQEELGPATDGVPLTVVGMRTVPSSMAVFVLAHINCTFSELKESAKTAPDGYESNLVCFDSPVSALTALGDDCENASGQFLGHLTRLSGGVHRPG